MQAKQKKLVYSLIAREATENGILRRKKKRIPAGTSILMERKSRKVPPIVTNGSKLSR